MTLIAVGVIALQRIVRFVHSEEFAQFLAAKAGEFVNAEAKLQPLHWQGDSAISEGLVLMGTASAALERLEAKVLRAEWNWRALLAGTWKIENVDIQNLNVTLKPQTVGPGAPKPHSPETGLDSAKLTSWLPLRFEFGSFDVRHADLNYGEIHGTGHTMRVLPVVGGCNIEVRGGSLHIPGLPPLALAQSHIRERDGIYHLDHAQLFPPGGGTVSASGISGKDSQITIQWEGVPVSGVPVPLLAKYLDGTTHGRATFDSNHTWSGNISFSGARLHDLPVLKSAASFLRNPEWVNPPIQKLSADFQWDAGNLMLKNIVIESTGFARIEGGVLIAPGGVLSGQIDLGLDLNALKLIPGVRETIFSTARDGWYWSPVGLGGTLQNPHEDLSPRLAACVAGAELLKKGEQAVESMPSRAIDSAKDFLNIFAPLVP